MSSKSNLSSQLLTKIFKKKKKVKMNLPSMVSNKVGKDGLKMRYTWWLGNKKG